MEINKQASLQLKGIAILLMVWHHLFAYVPINQYVSCLPVLAESYTIEQIIGLFGKVCVSLFFFLGGYAVDAVYKADYNYQAVFSHIKKLYFNYWIMFIIFVPIGFIFHYLKEFDLAEFVLNAVALSCSYNSEWWFLGAYMIILLIAPPLIKIKSNKCLFSVSFVLIALNYVVRLLGRHFLSETSLLTFVWDFIDKVLLGQFPFFIGYIFSRLQLFSNCAGVVKRLNPFICIVGLALMVLCSPCLPGGMIKLTILAVFLIILCYPFLTTTKKFLLLEGKLSMNIWLTHTFICKYYWPELVCLGGGISSVLIFILTMTLSSLIAWLLYKFQSAVKCLVFYGGERCRKEKLPHR